MDTGVIYLDVAIGLAVAFFLLSLIPSGINEAIAFVTRIRSKFLWAYLNQLFTKAPDAPADDDGDSPPPPSSPSPPSLEDSARSKASRFVPEVPAPKLAPVAIAAAKARAAEARAQAADPAASRDVVVAASADDDAGMADLAERTQAVTKRMEESVLAPSAMASVGLPSTSWEMLSLMRASGARDPRPTLGGGVLDEKIHPWSRLTNKGATPHPAGGNGGSRPLPVVADLHRRLGPIAVAANAAKPIRKQDKPTTTKHIPPRSLALALVDLLTGSGTTDAQVAAKLDGLAGTPIHSTLVSLWTSTKGSLKDFGDELESWFDAEMARLTGLYKRLMRWVLGAAAVVVVLLVNLDPIGLTRDLWRDPARRAEFVAAAETAAASDGSGDVTATTAASDQGEPSVTPELTVLYAACRPDPSSTSSTTTTTSTTSTTIAEEEATTTTSSANPADEVAAAAAAVERVRNCVTDALDAQRKLGLLNDSVWEFDNFKSTWGWSWNLAVLHVFKLGLVAGAIFFGAPFWWDVVRRLMGIRKSVVKSET